MFGRTSVVHKPVFKSIIFSSWLFFPQLRLICESKSFVEKPPGTLFFVIISTTRYLNRMRCCSCLCLNSKSLLKWPLLPKTPTNICLFLIALQIIDPHKSHNTTPTAFLLLIRMHNHTFRHFHKLRILFSLNSIIFIRGYVYFLYWKFVESDSLAGDYLTLSWTILLAVPQQEQLRFSWGLLDVEPAWFPHIEELYLLSRKFLGLLNKPKRTSLSNFAPNPHRASSGFFAHYSYYTVW